MLAGTCYTLVAVIAGVLLWVLASGGQPVSIPSGDAPADADLARLHEIRDRVVDLRGLDVADEAREGYLSRDALAEYVDEAYSEISHEDRRAIETQNIVLRMLRMIGPEDDLLKISAASSALGIAGYYDFTERSLVVVADALDDSLSQESTLAHEYTHALQDERFDLRSYVEGYDIEETEYGATLPCIYEGDASLLQTQYMEDVYGDLWVTLLLAEYSEDTELTELAEELAETVPPAYARYTYFNYNECASFVRAVWEEGGWDAVDALYENPPSTTEQVLHPERYMDGETAIEVALMDLSRDLGLGWKLSTIAAFGEFDVYNYLRTAGLAAFAATSTAEGWGGGKMHVYTLGGGDEMQVLLHIALVWDRQVDLSDFKLSFGTAIERLDYLQQDFGDRDVWSWSSPGEYGRAHWDEGNSRVDLLFGTDETVVGSAQAEISRE